MIKCIIFEILHFTVLVFGCLTNLNGMDSYYPSLKVGY